MTSALQPSPRLLEKLVGIVHAAYHATPPDSPLRALCYDDEVVAWAKEMRALGLLPPLPVYEERKP